MLIVYQSQSGNFDNTKISPLAGMRTPVGLSNLLTTSFQLPLLIQLAGNCLYCKGVGPTPVTARSKAWVCGRSLAGIACGFESCRMYECLSFVSVVCCQVEVSATGRPITRPEESYRMWSRATVASRPTATR